MGKGIRTRACPTFYLVVRTHGADESELDAKLMSGQGRGCVSVHEGLVPALELLEFIELFGVRSDLDTSGEIRVYFYFGFLFGLLFGFLFGLREGGSFLVPFYLFKDGVEESGVIGGALGETAEVTGPGCG